jgi:PAS domain S-box-containing protein
MLDPEGRIVIWNVGAEKNKGYSVEEIIGRHHSIFFTREEIEAGVPEQELKVAAAEGGFEDEGWRLRKDGSRFWANVVTTALRDSDGTLRGFSKVVRDITDRKKAEDALRESEERYRIIAETASDVIITIDQDSVISLSILPQKRYLDTD